MLLRYGLLISIAAIPSRADILVVPPHEQYSGSINQASINSDSEIVAELDYSAPSNSPSGISFPCTNCPLAVNSAGSRQYELTNSDVETTIEVSLDTAHDRVNLNGNPFLNAQMRDLHQPQTTNQSVLVGSYPSAYTGPLPITYEVNVVQVRTVQLEDRSLVEFYSVDLQILSLGHRAINVEKLILLPFTTAYPKTPRLLTVSVPDSPGQSSTLSSIATARLAAPIATGTTLASATSAGLRLPINRTSGGRPTVASHTTPPPTAFTGATSSFGMPMSILLASGIYAILAMSFSPL
ncbi:MAG: hypothetical protein Q9191_000588 [Dirinaria sp. TL-2023a]